MLRDGPSGTRRVGDGGVTDVLTLRRLGAVGLAELGRDELMSELRDIERLANRLAGYRAEVLGALDQLDRSGAAPDAAPYLSLREAAGVSESDARRLVRSGEKVREHGVVLVALSDGDINPAQAEVLSDARVPEDVRDDLVVAAASENTDETRQRVRRAEVEHSSETSMERFERQRQARGAGWRRDHEGMLRLWAKFDPHTGAQIEAQLEALRREYWNDDKQVRNGRRTPAQRDADVLAYVLAGIALSDADADAVERLRARARRRGLAADGQPVSRRVTPRKDSAERTAPDGGKPGRGVPEDCKPGRTVPEDCGLGGGVPEGQTADGEFLGSEPWLPPAQISVLIGLDALRRRTDEMGLTDAGTELPPELVRRLACDAEIIPIMLDGPGGSADAGHARRTVTRRLRRLLVARDRHCRWPGCHEPPSRCDAHHVIHWLDGGPTNLDNLVLLCHRHHQHLHEHGYKMVPQADGTWTTAQASEPESAPRRSARQPRGP